jgi:uncharacterized membrane protein YraQ (UPF0718 family)
MARSRLIAVTLAMLAVLVGTLALDALLPILGAGSAPDVLQNFATVFLGIFIEAAPFLLLGTVASGLIAVFVAPDALARFIPRNRALATLAGSLLGIFFPVCECGVVPVARRLYQKGLPASAGIAFLLGAPVLNPIVIASTYAAFGLGPIFWARIALTFAISAGVGLVFSAQPGLAGVLRLAPSADGSGGSAGGFVPVEDIRVETMTRKLQRAFGIAADEFFEMGRYLVAGALIATTLQTFVPQTALLAIGTGPVTSVAAMAALAFVLSVCSTVDAFLALSFVNTFTPGALVTFLVFGPMVDIKSTLMFLGIFRRRVVAYLILLPLLAALAAGLAINLNLGW